MHKDNPNAVDICLGLIEALPHAAQISKEDALRWVRTTMAIDPERIEWHIARAGGIGGSEAGSIMSWAYGDYNAREGADRLARRKLLMLAPDRPNFDMARGNKLEPYIRQTYEERLTQNGQRWTRRDDLLQRVESSPHPAMPWMRASLDGIYDIDGQTTIVDFKAPSEDSLVNYMQHHDYNEYAAQLNHYALVAQGHGVHVDALELVFFDYRHVATEGVRITPIAIDPEMQDRLADAAAMFWSDHIMHGQLPNVDRRPVLSHADVPDHIEHSALLAVNAKMLLDHFKEVFETERTKVSRWVEGVGTLNNGILPLGSMADGERGMLEVKSRMVLDTELALERLRQLGAGEDAIDTLRLAPALDSKKERVCYGDALNMLREVAFALESGEAAMSGDALALQIRGLLTGVPNKEKSGFDPDKITAALESFGEVAYHYYTERVVGNLPLGRAQDVLERRDIVGRLGDEMLVALVPCMQVDQGFDKEPPSGPARGL